MISCIGTGWNEAGGSSTVQRRTARQYTERIWFRPPVSIPILLLSDFLLHNAYARWFSSPAARGLYAMAPSNSPPREIYGCGGGLIVASFRKRATLVLCRLPNHAGYLFRSSLFVTLFVCPFVCQLDYDIYRQETFRIGAGWLSTNGRIFSIA